MKKPSSFSLLVFSTAFAMLSGIFFGPLSPVYAQAGIVSGKIQAIRSLEGNQFELVVAAAGGTRTVVASEQTLVNMIVPVERIKAGESILVPRSRGGGSRGFSGVKDPLSGMSDAAKKQLGLPDIPDIGAVPDTRSIPDKQQLDAAHDAQEAMEAAAKAREKMSGQETGAVPSAGGPAGSAPEKKPEPPKMPPAPEMLGPERPALSSPTGPAGLSRKKVIGAEQTDAGVRMQIEDEEGNLQELLLPPGSEIRQLLHLSDLKQDMMVQLQLQTANNSRVEQITVI